MRRINIGVNYGEVRKILRERLVRFLPTFFMPKVVPQHDFVAVLSDQDLVEFFKRIEIQAHSDVDYARQVYERVRLETNAEAAASADEPELVEKSEAIADSRTHFVDGAAVTVTVSSVGPNYNFAGLKPVPSFDELVTRGWILVSCNRFSVPRPIAVELYKNTEACTSALRAISSDRSEHEYSADVTGLAHGSALRELLHDVNAGEYVPTNVTCLSPEWVAARMWDCDDAGGKEQRFSRWLDIWSCLRQPAFSAHQYLEKESFEDFIGTAMQLLEGPDATPDWAEFESRVGRPERLLRSLESEQRCNETETRRRAEWLGHGMAEHAVMEHMATRGAAIAAVVLNELDEGPFDSIKIGPRFMELAIQRPVLLAFLGMRARHHPAILADMLLAKETCSYACSVIAKWHFNDGGWFPEFQASANATTCLLAFEDALAILGGYLDAGDIPAAELASLYESIYAQTENARTRSRAREMLALLREELTTVPTEYYDSVVSELVGEAMKKNYPVTLFGAALDLAADSGCIERINSKDIVECYLDVVLPRGDRLLGKTLDTQGAQALCTLALKAGDALKEEFLGAIDLRKWREEYEQDSAKRSSSFESTASARIRLHTRILARAVAGWPTSAPQEIVNALAGAIWAGATDRPTRGQYAAFSPPIGFGNADSQEISIAVDIAAALMKLSDENRELIVNRLCAVDEPTVLAGIVAETSESVHELIKKQLEILTPEASQEVYTYTQLAARVDALLSAEMVDAAMPYVKLMREAESRAAGRHGLATGMLRTELRIEFLRKDWDAIARRNPPRMDYNAEQREQYDLVRFFQAISELAKPDGDIAAAEQKFKELEQKNSGVTAYPLNLFASRVHRLLKTDSLQLLRGEALSEARRYLVDAEKQLFPRIKDSPAQLRTLHINRAILHLAAGQPRQALDLLNQLRDGHPMEHVEGFRALAIARLSSVEEARTALTAVERVLGRTDFLEGIRKNIEESQPFPISAYLTTDEDPVRMVQNALYQFHIMGHISQAQVLSPYGRVEQFLLEEVRGACSSLTGLVPMMPNLGHQKEDDISGLLKQLLQSRLLFPKWEVGDQSRGGWSESGGTGERDLVIRKGTTEIALIEAVKVDSVNQPALSIHFRKLFGYGECSIFFHLTYVKKGRCDRIVEFLKSECKAAPSPEIQFVRIQDLPTTDSSPLGFEAHYRGRGRNYYVVFLVLDLDQAIPREAAANQDKRKSTKDK